MQLEANYDSKRKSRRTWFSLSTTANGLGLYAPVSAAQTYGHDNVDRITSSSETASGSTSWSRGFGYDQFGNMWVSNSSVSLNGFTPASNIFTNNQASNNTYSGAGNPTVLGPIGTQLAHDAESAPVARTPLAPQ
jgi:hypothetical protein